MSKKAFNLRTSTTFRKNMVNMCSGSMVLKLKTLGTDYMILFDRYEILSHSAAIPAILQTLHKLYPAISCEKLHSGKTGSFFCTAGIPL